MKKLEPLIPEITLESTILRESVEKYEQYTYIGTNRRSFFMLPLGQVHIIFQLDGDVDHQALGSKKWDKRPNVFVGGPYTSAYYLNVKPLTSIFSVVFRLGKARKFIHSDLLEISDRIVHPSEIWGNLGAEYVECILECKSFQDRVTTTEKFLLSCSSHKDRPEIGHFIKKLKINIGKAKIEELRKEINVSKTHFGRLFKENVGMNPKQLHKLLRVQSLVHFARQQPHASLTEMAYKFGYFDQSHFIREFKSITGLTPKVLI